MQGSNIVQLSCPAVLQHALIFLMILYTGEACEKPGSRMPYLQGGFGVTGLPSGIEFKKPNNYGNDKINKIMECREKIAFHLKDNPVDCSENKSSHDLFKVFSKVVDGTQAKQVVAGRSIIEESDLGVTDFVLSEAEYQQLVTKHNHCFTEDAMISLRANYETSCKHEGYILPIYTESVDPYWLFYFPGNLSDLHQSMQGDQQVWGYWFNTTKDAFTFQLLLSKKKVSIQPISVISSNQDGDSDTYLFLRQAVLLKNRSKFTMPEMFHNDILTCLDNQGFV